MKSKTTNTKTPFVEDEDEANIEEEFRYRPERMRRVPRDKRIQPSPEALKPENTKVRITMYVDLDVLNFFKSRAAEPGSAPYQTQMNNALRSFMNGEGESREALLSDEEFIRQVAAKVASLKKPKASHTV